jgi:hypothetical protein
LIPATASNPRSKLRTSVRIDEDHASPAPGIPASISAKRPASVSASIVSMSTFTPAAPVAYRLAYSGELGLDVAI